MEQPAESPADVQQDNQQPCSTVLAYLEMVKSSIASRISRIKISFRLLVCIVAVASSVYSCSTTNSRPTTFIELKERQYKLTDICGKQHENHQPNLDKIHLAYGGKANQHSWPWVVFLLQTREVGGQVKVISHCAATLIPLENNEIDSDILVTSAACVTKFKPNKGENLQGKTVYRDEKEFDAYVDLYQMKPPSELGTSIKVKKFLHHKDYDGKTHKLWSKFHNDIALVKLETPIKFSEKVRPICLPEQSYKTPLPGTECIVVGWGRKFEVHYYLHELQLTVQEENICRDTGRPLPGRVRGGWGESYIHDMLLCALPYRDAQGTAGSPLVYLDKKDGRWKLYGILHYGDSEHSTKIGGQPPPLFTRVSTYAHWIEDTIPERLSV